jgi:hypothetical protein
VSAASDRVCCFKLFQTAVIVTMIITYVSSHAMFIAHVATTLVQDKQNTTRPLVIITTGAALMVTNTLSFGMTYDG